MTLSYFLILAGSCLLTQQPLATCAQPGLPVRAETQMPPQFTGEAVDVALSAEAALAWDWDTGRIVYQKNAYARRPVASLSKLLSVLAVRSVLEPNMLVTIPPEVVPVQRQGADIELPVGDMAQVRDLLAASLIPSANDAMVALAVAARGSEAEFVTFANTYAQTLGLRDTHLATSTGLSGGEQYSTAADVRRLLSLVHADSMIAPFLARPRGELKLASGKRRAYTSTNKLLGTYLPVLAAKTGYTTEAGENLALITERSGRKLGAVILGSQDRFQDMKVLVDWVWRNYTWSNG